MQSSACVCVGFISGGDTVSVPETGGGVCLSCCVTLGYVHLKCVNINVVFMFFLATKGGDRPGRQVMDINSVFCYSPRKKSIA